MLYCYEIQLEPRVQRKGLGGHAPSLMKPSFPRFTGPLTRHAMCLHTRQRIPCKGCWPSGFRASLFLCVEVCSASSWAGMPFGRAPASCSTERVRPYALRMRPGQPSGHGR